MLPPDDRQLLTQAMNGINFGADEAALLMSMFDDSAESLEDDRVLPVSAASFGGSYTGGQRLATNARMAHEAVTLELKKMAAGLRAMSESVDAIGKDYQNADDMSAGTSKHYEAGTACVSAPTWNDNVCGLPTDKES